MKLDVHIQVFEKFCSVRHWLLLSFSTKKKYFTIFQIVTCRKLKTFYVVLFNKRFKRFPKKKATSK